MFEEGGGGVGSLWLSASRQRGAQFSEPAPQRLRQRRGQTLSFNSPNDPNYPNCHKYPNHPNDPNYPNYPNYPDCPNYPNYPNGST